MSLPITVFVPHGPVATGSFDTLAGKELIACIKLSVIKPHRGNKAELLEHFPTYQDAMTAHEVTLQQNSNTQFGKGRYEQFLSFDPSNMMCEREWKNSGPKGNRREVMGMPWYDMVWLIDPDLCKQAGLPRDFSNSCWTCLRPDSKTGGKLMRCSLCHQAKYCSQACQRLAWWHHSVDIGENGCQSLKE